MSIDRSLIGKQGSAGLAFLATIISVPIGSGALTDAELISLSENSAAVAEGKEVYQAVCFSCHGQNLEGGTGFSLRDGEWTHGSTPTQILASLSKGFPEKGMVAFGAVYDEPTLEKIVAYLLSKQIGLRELSYQIYHSAPTNVSLERLTGSRPSRSGVSANNYIDTSLAEVDHFAIVFEGLLLAPATGRHWLRIGKGNPDVVKVEIDGAEVESKDAGDRIYQYPVKNGRQSVRLSYLKRDTARQLEVYLQGDSLYEPLSELARKRMLQTSFLIKATERPVVLRKKIENLPPKSIAVGHAGSLNYAFSPATNSIVGLWDGEFLNVGPNIEGRGKDPSRILGEWLFYDSPGIQLLVEGEPLKGTFVKYTVGDTPRFEYADPKRRVRVSAQPNGSDSIRFVYELEGFGKKRITLRLPEKSLDLKSSDGAVLGGRFIVDKAKRSQFSITLSK